MNETTQRPVALYAREAGLNLRDVWGWAESAPCAVDEATVNWATVDEAYGLGVELDEAPAMCTGCPFAKKCAAAAVIDDVWLGWFGGLSPVDRAALAVAAGLEVPVLVDGFVAGGRGDIRHGQPARYASGCRCDDCVRAAGRARRESTEFKKHHGEPESVEKKDARNAYRRAKYAALRAAGVTRDDARNRA